MDNPTDSDGASTSSHAHESVESTSGIASESFRIESEVPDHNDLAGGRTLNGNADFRTFPDIETQGDNLNDSIKGSLAFDYLPGINRTQDYSSMNDSFDSILAHKDRENHNNFNNRLQGLDNEAYDGDAETDISQVYQISPVEEFPEKRRKENSVPLPHSTGSSKYQKNPSVERRKGPHLPPGPYDPQVGVYITPPITKSPQASSTSTNVRKRIPRPPSKGLMRFAYAWSCITCLLGSFFCAIPALRYTLSASESKKIGDFNSAHSYMKKVIILCVVATVVAVTGWTLIILYLTGHLG